MVHELAVADSHSIDVLLSSHMACTLYIDGELQLIVCHSSCCGCGACSGAHSLSPGEVYECRRVNLATSASGQALSP